MPAQPHGLLRATRTINVAQFARDDGLPFREDELLALFLRKCIKRRETADRKRGEGKKARPDQSKEEHYVHLLL
jgi:hypothetical protein